MPTVLRLRVDTRRESHEGTPIQKGYWVHQPRCLAAALGVEFCQWLMDEQPLKRCPTCHGYFSGHGNRIYCGACIHQARTTGSAT